MRFLSISSASDGQGETFTLEGWMCTPCGHVNSPSGSPHPACANCGAPLT